MAKTTLLLVWNIKILSPPLPPPPLNADDESLEIRTVKISWLLKKIKLLNKPYFLQKRKQFFCVNLFSNTQKQNDESELSVNMHCIIAFKTVQLDVKLYVFWLKGDH